MKISNVDPKIFKAYDIRGVYPEGINEYVVSKICRAIFKLYTPKKVLIGRDGRGSSFELRETIVKEFNGLGVAVVDIGLATSDQFYFAGISKDADIGMMVTASHNPPEYNGLKIIGKAGKAFSGDDEISAIRDVVLGEELEEGKITERNTVSIDTSKEYVSKLRELVNFEGSNNTLSIVADPGNGMAGPHLDALFSDLPIKVNKICSELDPAFSCRGPNPFMKGALDKLTAQVLANKADMGLAWDSDADRFVVVSDSGKVVPGDFITALLAEKILKDNPGGTIIYDVRASRAVPKTISENGGNGLMWKVGHSFIKTKMRELGSVFAGENSGHYYFKDFHLLDSGLLSALVLLALCIEKGKKISELLAPFEANYFLSGEINFETDKGRDIIDFLQNRYREGNIIDIDGLRIEFNDYWFSIRLSNTEPLLRLNLEANSKELMENKLKEISGFIEGLS